MEFFNGGCELSVDNLREWIQGKLDSMGRNLYFKLEQVASNSDDGKRGLCNEYGAEGAIELPLILITERDGLDTMYRFLGKAAFTSAERLAIKHVPEYSAIEGLYSKYDGEDRDLDLISPRRLIEILIESYMYDHFLKHANCTFASIEDMDYDPVIESIHDADEYSYVGTFKIRYYN